MRTPKGEADGGLWLLWAWGYSSVDYFCCGAIVGSARPGARAEDKATGGGGQRHWVGCERPGAKDGEPEPLDFMSAGGQPPPTVGGTRGRWRGLGVAPSREQYLPTHGPKPACPSCPLKR